jgi:rRNA maturation endonuclease Nob1
MTPRPVDLLLARLNSVVRSGAGWRAECPACGGRGRKIAVTEADSGGALLHCFAGCDASAIVAAMGLRLTDLFPARQSADTVEARRANQQVFREAGWRAALSVLAKEVWVVATAAKLVADRAALSNDDSARLALAMERIESAKAVLCDR